MQVDAAIVREQGITFAVVAVKSHVLLSRTKSDEMATALEQYWPAIPIVLMSQDGQGRPKYYGRSDIVGFLTSTPVEALPWKTWSVH